MLGLVNGLESRAMEGGIKDDSWVSNLQHGMATAAAQLLREHWKRTRGQKTTGSVLDTAEGAATYWSSRRNGTKEICLDVIVSRVKLTVCTWKKTASEGLS